MSRVAIFMPVAFWLSFKILGSVASDTVHFPFIRSTIQKRHRGSSGLHCPLQRRTKMQKSHNTLYLQVLCSWSHFSLIPLSSHRNIDLEVVTPSSTNNQISSCSLAHSWSVCPDFCSQKPLTLYCQNRNY